MYFEMSAIIPELTTCPARDVPPARSVRLVFSSPANFNIFLMSEIPLGQATASGSSLYTEASVEYIVLVILSYFSSPARLSARASNLEKN